MRHEASGPGVGGGSDLREPVTLGGQFRRIPEEAKSETGGESKVETPGESSPEAETKEPSADELRAQLESLRGDFLNTKHEHRGRLDKVKAFLGLTDDGEELPEVKTAREAYETKQKELSEKLVAEAIAQGGTPDEINERVSKALQISHLQEGIQLANKEEELLHPKWMGKIGDLLEKHERWASSLSWKGKVAYYGALMAGSIAGGPLVGGAIVGTMAANLARKAYGAAEAFQADTPKKQEIAEGLLRKNIAGLNTEDKKYRESAIEKAQELMNAQLDARLKGRRWKAGAAGLALAGGFVSRGLTSVAVGAASGMAAGGKNWKTGALLGGAAYLGGEYVVEGVQDAYRSLTDIPGQVSKFVGGALDDAGKGLGNAVDSAKALAGQAGDAAWEGIGNWTNSLVELAGDAKEKFDPLGDALAKDGSEALREVAKLAGEAQDSAAQWAEARMEDVSPIPYYENNTLATADIEASTPLPNTPLASGGAESALARGAMVEPGSEVTANGGRGLGNPEGIVVASNDDVAGSGEIPNNRESSQSQADPVSIKRLGWYDNDTPKPTFDRNELKLNWGGEHGSGVDASGNYVLNVKGMTSDGSFHGKLSADAQQLLGQNKLEMLFSASKDGPIFKVPINPDGTVSIDPNDPVLGKFFEMGSDGKAHFIGRFAEVAEVVDPANANDSVERVRILSTLEGKGVELPDAGGSEIHRTGSVSATFESVDSKAETFVSAPTTPSENGLDLQLDAGTPGSTPLTTAGSASLSPGPSLEASGASQTVRSVLESPILVESAPDPIESVLGKSPDSLRFSNIEDLGAQAISTESAPLGGYNVAPENFNKVDDTPSAEGVEFVPGNWSDTLAGFDRSIGLEIINQSKGLVQEAFSSGVVSAEDFPSIRSSNLLAETAKSILGSIAEARTPGWLEPGERVPGYLTRVLTLAEDVGKRDELLVALRGTIAEGSNTEIV